MMLSDQQNSRDTATGAWFPESSLKQLECNIGSKESDAKGLKLSNSSWQRTWPLHLLLQLPQVAVTPSSHRLVLKIKSSLALVKCSDTAMATAVKKPMKRLRLPLQSRS